MPARQDFQHRLERELDRIVPDWRDRRLAVALSGGVDSTLLLGMLARLVPVAQLKAVHVDHGLHGDSAAWSEHCRALAATLGVEFVARRVAVERAAGESLEAAARRVRYAALLAALDPEDVLLTAHHGDDQLETVLLRMLRGTGLRGLAAIHASGTLDGIVVARPLLGFARAEIRSAAEALGLRWLEDPANADAAFDRSFLRTSVVPALRGRWPAAHVTARRLAEQMHEAEEALGDLARIDIGAVDDPSRVSTDVLLVLSRPRQANALRYLLRMLGLPPPSRAQLDEVIAAIASQRPDAEPLVAWPGAEARVYRGHVYLMAPLGPRDPGSPARVALGSGWRGEGALEFARTDAEGLPDAWVRAGLDVRFRAGGERFKPLGDAHTRSLKHWFQDNAVVPWMRDRVPLLYRGDVLVAVADLCLTDEVARASDASPRWRPVWSEHRPIR